MIPVTVQGDGIVLRPWELSDADDELIAACNDPVIVRFLPGIPHPYTLKSATWWVTEGAPAAWESGGAAFTIREPGTDRLLGGVGLGHHQALRKQAEVGYWVSPGARGAGVASTATRAISDWAFKEGFHRLELLAAKENPASLRVALNSGYTKEGVRREGGPTREGRQDLVIFARIATDPPGPVARRLPDLSGGKLSDGVIELRRLAPSDADDYLALCQLPEVAENHIGQTITREIADMRCAQAEFGWVTGDMAQCVIVDAASGSFAGDISLYYRDPFTKQAMLGYSLRPEFRGRGFATRAVNLLTEWAFEHAGAIRVIAGTFPPNDASRAVLIRAGFEREAYMKAALPGHDGKRIDDIQFVRISPLVNPS